MMVFRKHVKADDAPQAIQAARITEDEVETVKKELLEDEDWCAAGYLYPDTQ